VTMKFSKTHTRTAMAAIAAAAALIALLPRWLEARQIASPNREHKMAARLDTTRTTCFGRYLIDIPEHAETALGRATSDSNNIERIANVASDDALARMADAREQQLRMAPHDSEQTLFKSAVRSTNGRNRVIVSRPKRDDVELFLVETVARADGAAWKVSYTTGLKYLDVTIKQIGDIADSLRYRAESAVPNVPGACIKDGLLLRTPLEVEEFAGGARVKPLSWSLDYETEISGHPDKGDSLWERSDRAISMAGSASGIRKLRRAPIEVNGLVGQEYVALYPDKGATIFDAKAELYGDGTPRHATVKLHMVVIESAAPSQSGNLPPLTTEESLEIWDASIKSVRLRPGAF
jgi:hypothetical protein